MAVGEGEGLVLGVNVDDTWSQSFEERKLYRGVVGESKTLGRRKDFPTENKEIVIVDIGLLEKRLQTETRDVETGLDDTLTLLVGQHGSIGPLSQQQAESTQHDTLSGTRLACDGNKAIPKMDIRLTDESVVFYV